jgi:hypothetical protein
MPSINYSLTFSKIKTRVKKPSLSEIIYRNPTLYTLPETVTFILFDLLNISISRLTIPKKVVTKQVWYPFSIIKTQIITLNLKEELE